ncbi:MAG: hypothetical protein JNM09_09265 [Blastocatellia bacterium]|nr:hypothetical protein [Blastocatellia bacterium]
MYYITENQSTRFTPAKKLAHRQQSVIEGSGSKRKARPPDNDSRQHSLRPDASVHGNGIAATRKNAVCFIQRGDLMSVQTTTIEVDQLTAVILKAKAEAKGLAISALLRSLAEIEAPMQQHTLFEIASPEERARAVEKWASRQRSMAPPLSDEAISRDRIYGEREDKQL